MTDETLRHWQHYEALKALGLDSHQISEVQALIRQDRRELLERLKAQKQTVKVVQNRRWVTDENFEVVPLSVIESELQQLTGGETDNEKTITT